MSAGSFDGARPRLTDLNHAINDAHAVFLDQRRQTAYRVESQGSAGGVIRIVDSTLNQNAIKEEPWIDGKPEPASAVWDHASTGLLERSADNAADHRHSSSSTSAAHCSGAPLQRPGLA
jgi:hypothetical protein